MIKRLQEILRDLDEAIEYAEVTDMAYTRFYTSLIRQRKAIRKAIKVFEKTQH